MRSIGHAKSTSHEFDWSLFWLLQAIFLSAPAIITVTLFRGGTSLSPHRAMTLGFILIGLTILNVIVQVFRMFRASRSLREKI